MIFSMVWVKSIGTLIKPASKLLKSARQKLISLCNKKLIWSVFFNPKSNKPKASFVILFCNVFAVKDCQFLLCH